MSEATLSSPDTWQEVAIPCPHCGQPTTNLKRYRVFDYFLFLFLAAAARTVVHTACPSCMRKSLLVRTLVNIPVANVAWPVLLVVHSIAFARSFTHGHSLSILRILRGES